MKRCYRLTKKISDEQAVQAREELKALQNDASLELSEDHTTLTVKTDSENYYTVLTAAMNILERIEKGCNLSFDHFVYENKAE